MFSFSSFISDSNSIDLVFEKASILINSNLLYLHGKEGKTALHLAAENGELEVTQWLIEKKGMDPMVKTSQEGKSALHLAETGELEGETPYHLAAKENRDDSEYRKEKKKQVMDYLKKKEQSVMLNRLLGQGTYDSFDMRCMVTGQFGVGKSTLVKLLIGDAIPDERLATDGISLLEGRCGLDIDTREWVLIDPGKNAF
ncbi:unnamed protein product [Mytilus edulis]|uniref:Uncharacterized protein n=1 Tax=Mytilus edulis TaxID=6550 RepID=A0A8S3REB1_MYTED|nr:unnamed protein product [Mytilus edulis]